VRLRIALDDKLMDIRLRDKLLAEGKITKEQLEGYFAKLPDETGNFTMIETTRKKQPKSKS